MGRRPSLRGLPLAQLVIEIFFGALASAACRSSQRHASVVAPRARVPRAHPSAHATQPPTHSLIGILVGCLAVSASPAWANWLSSDDLERHCGAYLSDAVSAEAAGCIAFIQGYVAAADASSTPIEDDAESFAERAARTRAGSRLRGLSEEPASRRAFCVAGTPPAAVIEAVATYLSRIERAEDEPPEQIVHRALVAQFPCSDG